MFSGDDGTHGREPWVTDGTTAGTRLFADLNPGPAGSNPADITPAVLNFGIQFQVQLWYFSASDGTHGREFFSAYPGSPPPDVYDINPGPASSDPGPFGSVAQENGLIAATSAANGREVFQLLQPPLPPVIVGPQPGHATPVAGVSPGAGSDPVLAPTSQIGSMDATSFVTRTYFSGDDGAHGRQLWQADEFVFRGAGQGGTLSFGVAGVRLVDEINPGAAGSDPQGFASVGGTPVLDALTGGTEVFSANDGTHGRELWTSDGWPSNTAMAADINPGPASSDPRDITVIGLSTPTTTVTAGSPVTVHADLQPAPGEAEPSGRVTFYSGGTEIAAAQLVPDGSGGMIASATLTARSGTYPIVAVYQGDGTYTPATSNTLPLTGD
jgi:ELWxxDGT repeat protein